MEGLHLQSLPPQSKAVTDQKGRRQLELSQYQKQKYNLFNRNSGNLMC